jgi:hypothetical protein
MRRLTGRLDRLQKALAPHEGKRMLVVSGGYFGPTKLATSTCTRTRTNGVLIDCVTLDGCREDLTDEQLEKFIQSFPIQENDALPGRKRA